MAFYVGLDIGGTKTVAACADDQGTIVSRIRELTPAGFEDGLAMLHRLVAAVKEDRKIDGIGAAMGGPLDWKTGCVSPLHQPEWREVPIKKLMEERWQVPFFVDVDTNVAALGEYVVGTQAASRFLYITLSTGMGGGFLLDGALYRGGGTGWHPEIAHQSIPTTFTESVDTRCECGAGDCLEALVSGNGIRRVYGCPAEKLTPDQWHQVAVHLGRGLRNIATILAPEVIVFGGSVALGGGSAFLAQAHAEMVSRLRLVPAPRLELAELGHDAPLVGTFVIARQGL